MSPSTALPWESLETRRASAFLVAGLLWLADTTLLVLYEFADLSVLGTRGPVNPLLYMTGLVAAIVGLLGFYPELASRTRRLAVLGAGVIAVAGIAIPILLAWLVVGVLSNLPGPVAPLGILLFVVIVLGFSLFGIASVRTAVPSRAVGVLVLTVPAAIVGWLTTGFVVYGGDLPGWMSPTIGAIITVLFLAIGARLRTEDIRTDRTTPASGSPSR